MDVPTLNQIVLALRAGKRSPEDAGLPATAEVQRSWDAIKADLERLPPGAMIELVHDLPDLS